MSRSAPPEHPLQVVVFFLNDEAYGLDILYVNEILRNRQLTPIANAMPHVLGAMNLRGKSVVVLDLRRRLGMEPSHVTEASRIIVVEANGRSVGLLVDRVTEVLTLPYECVEPTPATAQDTCREGRIRGWQFVQAIGRQNGRRIAVLDCNLLVSVNTRT